MPSPNHDPRRDRRQFLALAGGAIAGGAIAGGAIGLTARASDATTRPAGRPLRAAVIGHTGRGDYGHGMDVCFNDVPNVEVVAVADPVAAGRAKAAQRCGAKREYDDYRAMLEKERPDLVSVAPRWSDQHRDMAVAAIAAGAHVYMEKPVAPSLAEADAIVAAAERANRKVVVAHQMRLSPSVVHLKRRVDDGLIGDLLQINCYGKMDARAGGEDLVVLACHLFDMARLFAGDAQWCTARILHQGRDATTADARAVKEQIGPVLGDEIFAQFAMPNGVNLTYTSRSKQRERSGHWGLELVGSKASARILADIWTTVRVMRQGPWEPAPRTDTWEVLPDDPGANADKAARATGPANRRVVDDWLAAIREDREPACSVQRATKALEMVTAVFRAGLSGARMPLPLTDRSHPLVTKAG